MKFRVWVQQKWFEHLAEIEAWNKFFPKYSQSEYIRKNKWWLKRQFRKSYPKVDKTF